MNRDFHDISSMRKNYESSELLENNTPESPFELFGTWFKEAKNSTIHEANAMVLATCDSNLKPSARVVLLKSVSAETGFSFFTNYSSRKGEELANNPYVSIVFYWDLLERQVRIEGQVEKLDALSNDTYFESRPIGSQIGAVISPQSKKIENKEFLQSLYDNLAKQDSKIERPENWGGYTVKANKIEFWQGRPNRLHDRIVYELIENNWMKYRLAP
ncbi:MAG: pyridoxamine 5'-phosphate oxidase [Bacteroidota bacterium]